MLAMDGIHSLLEPFSACQSHERHAQASAILLNAYAQANKVNRFKCSLAVKALHKVFVSFPMPAEVLKGSSGVHGFKSSS